MWPGLNPTCELSLLLVLSFDPRGFSPGAPEKNSPDSFNFQFDLEGADTFQPVLKKCSVWVNKLQKILVEQVLCLTSPAQRELSAITTITVLQSVTEFAGFRVNGLHREKIRPFKHMAVPV